MRNIKTITRKGGCLVDIIYHGIDKDGIPRVWGVTENQCKQAIEEYNTTKTIKKSLRVIQIKRTRTD